MVRLLDSPGPAARRALARLCDDYNHAALALCPQRLIALPVMTDAAPQARPDSVMPAAVSIIVPHFDDPGRLDKCLTALVAQRGLDTTPEIIVSDNGSPQSEAALMAMIGGRARLVHAPERGAGPARNVGVAASSGQRLAFTDADCIPSPDWLANGLKALEKADLIGGAMTVFVEHGGPKSPAEAFETVFAFDNEAYVTRKGFTVTANLFTRRAVFDAVGGFRVGLSEDLDWCRRATAAGYRLAYAADAIVGHPARADWPQLKHKWRRIQAETYALAPPTLGHRLRWLARAWAMPLSIVAHVPAVATAPALNGIGERWAAVRGLVQLRLWRMIDAHRLLFGGNR
jgi:GT2 family glycosyltransferase